MPGNSFPNHRTTNARLSLDFRYRVILRQPLTLPDHGKKGKRGRKGLQCCPNKKLTFGLNWMRVTICYISGNRSGHKSSSFFFRSLRMLYLLVSSAIHILSVNETLTMLEKSYKLPSKPHASAAMAIAQ